jgi:hypothetical protein
MTRCWSFILTAPILVPFGVLPLLQRLRHNAHAAEGGQVVGRKLVIKDANLTWINPSRSLSDLANNREKSDEHDL